MDRPVVEEDFSDGEPLVIDVADRDRRVEFADFYAAQYGPIVRVMLGLTGRQAIAEELTQEAMLATCRNWKRVRTLDNPPLWLRRVAVNRAISAHRRLVAEIATIARVRSVQSVGISSLRTMTRCGPKCVVCHVGKRSHLFCGQWMASHRLRSARCWVFHPRPHAPTSDGHARHSRTNWARRNCHER